MGDARSDLFEIAIVAYENRIFPLRCVGNHRIRGCWRDYVSKLNNFMPATFEQI